MVGGPERSKRRAPPAGRPQTRATSSSFAGVFLWTGMAWGGRIGLLADGEGWFDLLRIGGSLLLGLVTAVALPVPSLRARSAPLFYLFAFWTVGLWLRSMVVTWTGSGSLPFQLVHTVLAAGFFGLAYLVWKVARSRTEEKSLASERG